MRYQSLRERFKGPFDEERVWVDEYGQHVGSGGIDPDEIEPIVEDYAERIEQSFNAIAHIDRTDSMFIGDGYQHVVLVVIIGRGADKSLLETALAEASHQIKTELFECAEGHADE